MLSVAQKAFCYLIAERVLIFARGYFSIIKRENIRIGTPQQNWGVRGNNELRSILRHGVDVLEKR